MFAYGKFTNEENAAEAVRALMSSGFDVRYISALMRTDVGVREVPISVESGVKRGAVLGATFGAVGGALLGTAPGLLVAGPFLAALEAALGGTALGSIQGGILGAVFGQTRIDFEEEDLDQGAILIGVNADTRPELARKILGESGATRVRTREEPLPEH